MAVYNLNGELIAEMNEIKTYSFLAYNVGNFADNGDHSRYHGDDLEGWITEWIKFFGKYNADVCLLTESSRCVDSENTESSDERIYSPLYKFHSVYNPVDSFGEALLSDRLQKNIRSDMFQTRLSSGSKYLCAEINLNNVNVFVATVHFNHTVIGQETESISTRAAQMAEILAMADSYDNVIIGGDYNVASFSELSPFINAGYTLANGGIFGGFNTYPEKDPIYPCDNIAIKGNKLKLKDFEVFKGVTSDDHLATMTKILIG